jgi:predicted ATPase
MAFKILALKVNEDFSFVKNLQKKKLYRFTNDYEFYGYEDGQEDYKSITDIRPKGSYPADLYNIKLANKKQFSVSTSAILGKNGAGKSTLLELFYLLIYCLGEKRRYIKDRTFSQAQIDRGFNREYFQDYKDKVKKLLADAQIELFYELNGQFYVLANNGKQVGLHHLEGGKWKSIEYQPELFFYTICINYSLYGLNSGRDYFWLNPLFHKNDGYKTPLVLNPFRSDGVIDVNVELHLAQTRVLTNLVDKAFRSEKLIDEKEITEIIFDVIPADIGKIDAYDIGYIYKLTNDETKIDLIEVLETLITRYASPADDFNYKGFRAYLEDELDNKKNSGKRAEKFRFEKEETVNYDTIQQQLYKYCLTKIAKICIKYDEYEDFTAFSNNNNAPRIKLIKSDSKLITKLISDQSHITLKLKQALNALANNYLNQHEWRKTRDPSNIGNFIYRNSLTITEFRDMVKEGFELSGYKKKRVAQFIPTGMFKPTIVLTYPAGQTAFHQLSSGEQQMVHSIHSIIYHILNIETLENNTKYQSVNLILDEIELYYHPEYQRRFVELLLDTISKLELNRVRALNIIFSTHSPFILSDIPHADVLKMREGAQVDYDDTKMTFGANIHEMLTDTFFLGPELIGAFAKEKIESAILELDSLRELRNGTQTETAGRIRKRKNSNDQLANPAPDHIQSKFEISKESELQSRNLYKLISIIGEPVVRFKMLQMYDDLMLSEKDAKEKVKEEIQRMMERNGLTKNDL